MIEDISNLPLNISLDTQILPDILLPAALDELDIIRLNSLVHSSNNAQNYMSSQGNLKLALRNYCSTKFLRHLINSGKVKVHITPTAYSEIVHSNFINDIIYRKFCTK